MKNKLSYVVLAIMMCFSFLGNVSADEFNVIVSANANNNVIEKGKEVEITINVKSDSTVDSCSFNVASDTTLEYISMNPSVGTPADFTAEIDTDDPLTNGIDIIKIKYRVNDSGKVTITPSKCVVTDDQSLEDSSIDPIVIQITAQEPAVDTTLSDISVSGGKMAPVFASDIYSYTVLLDSPNFGLNLTTSDSNFQDKIIVKDASGKTYDNLNNIVWSDPTNQKLMKLDICVNNDCKYQLIVNYNVEGLDNSLSSLTINGKNIPLEAKKYEYQFTIPSDSENFELNAVLKDSNNFQIVDIELPGTFSVTDEVTYVALVVEPKSSTIAAESVTYNIEVKKEVKSPSGTTSNNGGSNKPNNNSNNDANKNPQTGDISMFIMLIILISSLVGSIVLYQKNLENYR